MTDKLEWLRYGALGFSGLALTTAAGLLMARVRGAPLQWHTNVRLFMAFSMVLALVAAATELLERIFPEPLKADVQRIAGSLDVSLGDKFQASIKNLSDGTPEKANLIYFTNDLCKEVTELDVLVDQKPEHCKSH